MKNSIYDKKDIAILASLGMNAGFLNTVEQACERASQHIVQFVDNLGARPLDIKQGNFAEIWHGETFNVDAVLNRMRHVAAEIPASNAFKSVDALIKDHGKVVDEYGLKYYKSAEDSVNAQKFYGDQKRLIPADQMNDAHKYIDKKVAKDISSGRENRIENAQELMNIRDKLTDRQKYGNAESQPLARKEAEVKLKEIQRDGDITIHPSIDASHIINESLRSGAIAAGLTIGTMVVPRIISAVLKDGKLSWNVLEGTQNKTIEAGLRGGVATSITVSAKAGLLGEAARGASPLLIGTLTFLVWEGMKDFTRYAHEKITLEQFAGSIAKKSIAAASGAYGALIGRSVIPVPVVGALVGAMVGSFVAQSMTSGLQKLMERPYKEMLLCTDAQRSFAGFIINSYNCQRYFDDWVRKMEASQKIYKQLEGVNKAYNDELKNVSSKL